MVPRVQRLQHQDEALGLAQFHARPEVLDHVGRLVVPRQALVETAGHDQRLAAAGSRHGSTPCRIFCRSISRVSLSRRTKLFVREIGVEDEGADRQTQPLRLARDHVLLFDRPVHDPVVEQGGETLVGDELDLCPEVRAGQPLELRGAWRVFQLEASPLRGCGRSLRGCRGRSERERGGGQDACGEEVPAVHERHLLMSSRRQSYRGQGLGARG